MRLWTRFEILAVIIACDMRVCLLYSLLLTFSGFPLTESVDVCNFNTAYYCFSPKICYSLEVINAATWRNASNVCIKHGGDLPALSSNAEHEPIKTFIEMKSLDLRGNEFFWVAFNSTKNKIQVFEENAPSPQSCPAFGRSPENVWSKVTTCCDKITGIVICEMQCSETRQNVGIKMQTTSMESTSTTGTTTPEPPGDETTVTEATYTMRLKMSTTKTTRRRRTETVTSTTVPVKITVHTSSTILTTVLPKTPTIKTKTVLKTSTLLQTTITPTVSTFSTKTKLAGSKIKETTVPIISTKTEPGTATTPKTSTLLAATLPKSSTTNTIVIPVTSIFSTTMLPKASIFKTPTASIITTGTTTTISTNKITRVPTATTVIITIAPTTTTIPVITIITTTITKTPEAVLTSSAFKTTTTPSTSTIIIRTPLKTSTALTSTMQEATTISEPTRSAQSTIPLSPGTSSFSPTTSSSLSKKDFATTKVSLPTGSFSYPFFSTSLASTPSPSGCFYNGSWHEVGDVILDYQRDNCTRLICCPDGVQEEIRSSCCSYKDGVYESKKVIFISQCYQMICQEGHLISAPHCGSKFAQIEHDGKIGCYHFSPSLMTRLTAQMYCLNMGAVLAEPATPYMLSLLNKYFMTEVVSKGYITGWLGAIKNCGLYYWQSKKFRQPLSVTDQITYCANTQINDNSPFLQIQYTGDGNSKELCWKEVAKEAMAVAICSKC